MMQTRSLLASAYRGRRTSGRTATLTHVYDTRADRVLCGKVQLDSLADECADDIHAPATCPTCATRDPRAAQHANDGPFLLKSLLQF